MLMKSIKIKHSYNSSTLFLCFRSSFSEFASKYGKDERFKGIEKMRERESIFSDYCSDLRRKEKEEKSSQKEKVGHLVGIDLLKQKNSKYFIIVFHSLLSNIEPKDILNTFGNHIVYVFWNYL